MQDKIVTNALKAGMEAIAIKVSLVSSVMDLDKFVVLWDANLGRFPALLALVLVKFLTMFKNASVVTALAKFAAIADALLAM